LIESIRSILIAKVEAIQQTVQGVEVDDELARIKNWKLEAPLPPVMQQILPT